MREGLSPHAATAILTFSTTPDAARAVTELLGEMLDPDETGVAAFEEQATGCWTVHVYFAEAPDEPAMRGLVAGLLGDAPIDMRFTSVAERDWVAAGLEGLDPVAAGRFFIHGRHRRSAALRRVNRISIELEAALAFGTGHHGTTLGCLRLFDQLLKTRRPARALDIGCGTGILAIAAARALKRPVVATDIDPTAVAVARANARANNVGRLLRFAVAPGLRDPLIRAGGPYDLIFANILAEPLRRMASAIGRALAPGGDIILSGLLARDARSILAAYRARGFRLRAISAIDGWLALRLERPASRPRLSRRSRGGACDAFACASSAPLRPSRR